MSQDAATHGICELQCVANAGTPLARISHRELIDKLYDFLRIVFVYSFIKSQVTDRTCLQSKYKLYEIRPTGTARRLATQWVREQPCKKINRKRKLQLNTVSLLRWRHICHESFRCWWESIPGSLTWEAR